MKKKQNEIKDKEIEQKEKELKGMIWKEKEKMKNEDKNQINTEFNLEKIKKEELEKKDEIKEEINNKIIIIKIKTRKTILL